ncbi:InlB B-repeat-containing protein, partial [Peptoniphilus indolicus]|uniref:InlB B-repeat-containing protein n=1 Tax=Peptoniphilus indolicus TaxID=33030 RepID=UPI00058D76C0
MSIGVVSCVVGAFVLFSPVKFGNAELSGVVYASEVENKNKAEKLKEELNKKREAFEEEVESLRSAYLGADASVKSKFFKTVAQLTSKLDEVDKKIKALNNYDTSEEQLNSLKIEIEKIDKEINDFSVEFTKVRLAKKINNLGYLSDKEKEAFISGVNTSTTINSVNIAFELAVEKDKANEIELKEKAKKEIEKLKTITDKSKNLAKKLIDKAKDKAEVEKIVAESKGLEDRKLNDLKEKAKKEIDELKEITDKSKNLAKKLIDGSKDKEEIGKIVDEAKRLEDRKQKEKPGQTKYTLNIKEVDKDGNVISMLKTVEDLTVEKLNEETEKFVDGADYKDETGNYKVVGTVEMDGTTAVVKVVEVFTVTFDSNGGSQVAPVVVKKGKEAAKPEDPTKEGFKFERWELEGKEYN